jgi:hypothetical protein
MQQLLLQQQRGTLHAGRCSAKATQCPAHALGHSAAAAHDRNPVASRRGTCCITNAGREDVLRQTQTGSSAMAAAAADAEQYASAAAMRQAFKSGKLAFGFSAGGLLFPVSCSGVWVNTRQGLQMAATAATLALSGTCVCTR